ncbi:MAG: nucleoside triphosphate pyrophosphohydrolase [Planctomycetes bacterium]|nr:nucleoside triphosphate pyrophosphohydrolase [Planctomycetota bacterium]
MSDAAPPPPATPTPPPSPVPAPAPPPAGADAFARLVEVMRRLRAPDGCPWDRQQTHDSLKRYLLEETYEVLEALDEGNPELLREELGDLLFQVVFLSRLSEERGEFTVHDAAAGIAEKLIRRHPWVFGDTRVGNAEEAKATWETLKAKERQGKKKDSVLDGIPKELPALAKALRLSQKAAKVGFDWPNLDAVLEKLDEEMQEFEEAARSGDREHAREELGDLFFVMANIARKLELDPEDALRLTNETFIRRFKHVERRLREGGKGPEDAGLEEMERLWEEAKEREGKGP